MVVSFPLLTRGHAIQCHALDEEYLQIQVPNLYYLSTALPVRVDTSTLKVYFDCKIRRLFIHACKKEEEPAPVELPTAQTEAEKVEAPEAAAPVDDGKSKQEAKEENTEDLADDIIEIDTDDHFGRKNTGKK